MGKGVIISGGAGGEYQVQILYNRDRYDDVISALDEKKVELEKVINGDPEADPVTQEEKYKGLQILYADKSGEVDDAIAELNLLIDELQALYLELEALQIELKNWRDLLVQYQGELVDLQEQVPPAPPASFEAKQVQISETETEISNTQTDISNKEEEITDKQTEVEAKQLEASDLDFEQAIIGQKIAEVELQIASIEKRIQYLEENMPEDETVSAWCADLTEDLSGDVGTVETPGEQIGDYGNLQIQPGYESNATYDSNRDGQLFPTIAVTPAQAFYNAAMLPGWQKWKPLFRYGIITAISDNLASITLDATIKSSQQDLAINRVATLTGVEFDYMDCDDGAFSVGDEVLIKFEPTAESVSMMANLDSLQDELALLLKELAILRNENANLAVDESQLLASYNALGFEEDTLNEELVELQEEDPQDPVAIAAKEDEITAKELEITNKETEINDKQDEITEQEVDMIEKEEEITDKRVEITAAENTIKNNMVEFAHPTVIGFKEEPQSCGFYPAFEVALSDSSGAETVGVVVCTGGGFNPPYQFVKIDNYDTKADPFNYGHWVSHYLEMPFTSVAEYLEPHEIEAVDENGDPFTIVEKGAEGTQNSVIFGGTGEASVSVTKTDSGIQEEDGYVNIEATRDGYCNQDYGFFVAALGKNVPFYNPDNYDSYNYFSDLYETAGANKFAEEAITDGYYYNQIHDSEGISNTYSDTSEVRALLSQGMVAFNQFTTGIGTYYGIRIATYDAKYRSLGDQAWSNAVDTDHYFFLEDYVEETRRTVACTPWYLASCPDIGYLNQTYYNYLNCSGQKYDISGEIASPFDVNLRYFEFGGKEHYVASILSQNPDYTYEAFFYYIEKDGETYTKHDYVKLDDRGVIPGVTDYDGNDLYINNDFKMIRI